MAISHIPEERAKQLVAIPLELATAPKIQKDLRKYISRITEPYDKVGLDDNIFDFAELVGYRVNNSALDIAEDLDVKSRYGIKKNEVPRTSVGRAFRGYDGEHFPDHEFEGLFGKGVHGTKINDIIEGIRYEKGGQATIETHGDQMSNGGRKLADMINPETEERYVVEAGRIGGRKSNEAQGNHLWSLEEIADIGELKYGEGLTWNDTTSKMNEKYGGDWSTSKVRDAYRYNKDKLSDEEE
ncbi:MAG: hypothetical protein CXT77_01770 [uncultured DHVE6 group euryarchaeote]|jgi:hypothetical protein|nr:MAG: hypothetical protein CXT77_01770 [uncultured DHVE6 group euryarchaeote]